MKHFLDKAGRKIRSLLSTAGKLQEANDDLKILMGCLLSGAVIDRSRYGSLADLEFKVFSQFGDDGIIQYLTHNLDLRHKTFVEFGVEDYLESNTRFLLQKDNWSGFVMDGSGQCIDRLTRAHFYWKHDLIAKTAFVTKDNIGQLLSDAVAPWTGLDLLHIDIDGNDFWIWKQIELNPSIVIVEYNSVFGTDRAITIPYAADFYRTKAHFSNLYWGSSLKALYILAREKGYQFIGCNGAGNNAYFVRNEMLNHRVVGVSLEDGYVSAKYRESRNEEGNLTYAAFDERTGIIRGLPVFDIEQDKVVPF